jgi:hypothetical protein
MIDFDFGFFKALISPITDFVKGRQAIKKAEVVAKIEQIERGEASNITMDQGARQAAGWMDDISFYAFLSPAFMCFYPPALPHIKAGFVALATMPLWWQYALGMMLISVWGYRKIIEPVIVSIAKVWINKLT